MLDEIRAELARITDRYADHRRYYCRVEVAALTGRRCILAGSVLDAATRTAVVEQLAAAFGELEFDAVPVHVLRTPSPAALTVATGVTGLYAEPSFLAEMLSQLLNGWTVELLIEEGRWCFVRQPDGYLGWAYRPYLAAVPVPQPTHLVCEPVSLLREAPSPEAPLVTRIPAGTAVAAEVEGAWARVALVGDPTAPLRPPSAGWVPVTDLRALAELPGSGAERRGQMVADARRFIGVPYLWGGCTALGIDCSGFAQLLHRLVGVILPRDADMQFDAGRPVDPPFHPGDLLFFGEGDRRKITHVGMSLGGWRIIHSSRSRNGVYEDDVQAVEHLRESFVAARTFVE